jgi:hypothetical protein
VKTLLKTTCGFGGKDRGGSGGHVECLLWRRSGALPEAKLGFDRFDIVQLMNRKLDQLRRKLQSEADIMQRKTLKGL